MAAEYEIKNIGYIGSLWQENFQPPINVGKTIEVANVPKTIERVDTLRPLFTLDLKRI